MLQPFRRRLLTGFAALLFGLIAAAGVARPAAAAYQDCFPVHDADGNIVDWYCFPVLVEKEPRLPDPCLCPYAILWDDPVLEIETVNERIIQGFTALDQAALTRDRAVRERLRDAAMGSFSEAAQLLGDETLGLGETGQYSPRTNVFEPDPQPWLDAAGQDILDGLGLLQQSLVEPVPQPWVDAAQEQFDEAFAELANQAPIGR